LNPAIKSMSALPLVQAKREADQAGAFEAILLNLHGELTEGTVSNLFWVSCGRLFTPSLDAGLLAGVTRALVIRLARVKRLAVRVGRFKASALKDASEIFLTSSGIELLPVTKVLGARGRGTWKIGDGRPGVLTRELLDLFQQFVRKRAPKRPLL
jgi:branched-chain amino acid aminotransferase